MHEPFSLEGHGIRLEPLTLDHVQPLAVAAGVDRSTYAYTWVPNGTDEARRYVESALEYQKSGRTLVWAVRRLVDDKIVGSTRFVDLEVMSWPPSWPFGGQNPEPSAGRPPSAGEIGGTWFEASAQRTDINTKLAIKRSLPCQAALLMAG